jgi:prolyl oligopeptidase
MRRSMLRPSPPRHCAKSVLRRSLGVVLVLCGVPPASAHAQLPASPAHPVVDTLHGTSVADPYRWLEDAGAGEVRAWFQAQGAHARAELGALPGRAALLARIRAIGAAAPPNVSLPREAGGLWFYTMRRPGEAVARGYVRDPRTGEERLIVDPATVGAGKGGPNALTSFLPSPDGRLVLYGVATGGSENAALRVRDVESGRDVDGPFERNRWDTNVWSPDGRTVYYIQLPDRTVDAPPEDEYRNVRVLRHRLGEQVGADVPVLSAAAVGEDDRLFPFIEIDGSSGVAFGVLSTGVQPHSAYFVAPVGDLATGTPAWRPLFALADSVLGVAAHGVDLYVLTQKGTPLGRIVRTALDSPDLAAAETVLAETDQRLRWMGAALDALYVDVFAAGTNRLTRIPWGGAPIPVTLPPGTSVSQTYDDPFRSQLRTDPLRAGVLLDLASWTAVSRPHRYDPSAATLEELPLRAPGRYDRLERHAVETVFAPSHDGVLVPLTLIRPDPLAREGSLPVLLDAYGAYGIIDAPRFVAERIPWFESGGASATCHVRGGGYHGAAWHRAGQRATKPNTWLDLIACAEFLVREGYTRPERVVAVGGSAGGITVGRAITERPDLFAGVIIQNGVLDAVRFETTPGGPANTHEFGSVATEEGFRALLAMSAVHHVRPQAYPAVLLLTSLGDSRVPSWQSGKMAAALQVATTSGRPVLLRVDEAAGHMPATFTDEQRRQGLADVYGFTMAVSGMAAYRPPTARVPGPDRAGLLISNLRLFDAATDTFSAPTGILIQDGRIQAVGPAAELGRPYEEIDAAGGFALPGLWDSHVHLSFLSLGGPDSVRAALEAFVQSGVLYVRDVGGPLDVMAAMRDRVRAGDVVGPEIFLAGPMVERPPLDWARFNEQLPGFTVPVESAAQVAELVRSVAAGGGSHLKVFAKWDPALLRQLVPLAEEAGLKLVVDPGAPFFQDIPIDAALAAGVASIEHAHAPWQSALPAGLRVEHDSLASSPDDVRQAFVERVASLGVEALDLGALRALGDRMAAAGAYFCPTLTVVEGLRSGLRPRGDASPEEVRRFWNGWADAATTITQVLAGRGVKLLNGQDGIDPAGTVGEMELLVAAGIPPADVLRAATLHPAQWLKLDHEVGSLQAGRRADLVIVRDDPLANMTTLRSQVLVLQGGTVRRRTGI